MANSNALAVRVVAQLVEVASIIETLLAREVGVSASDLDGVLTELEHRHAIQRSTISGDRYVSTTLEIHRVHKGLEANAGFASLHFHPSEIPEPSPEALTRWPAVQSALEIARRAGARSPSDFTNDDQLTLVDAADIERENEILMTDPEVPEDAFEWDSREGMLGPFEEAIVGLIGSERWAVEEKRVNEAVWEACSGLSDRRDAWGDDSYLDMKLVVLGRILGDAGRRTLPEAILRAYQGGAWPRFFKGSYPLGQILCVPFETD